MAEITQVIDRHGSITIDVSDIGGIDEMVMILKAILMWKGFSMQTIDDVFDEELKELETC